MIKEYKTISEVVGPLMLVKDVENVTYDELGEILLPTGERRMCRVLEINGSNALVQLFESSTGINLKESAVRFLGHGIEPFLRFRRTFSAGYLTAWDARKTEDLRS